MRSSFHHTCLVKHNLPLGFLSFIGLFFVMHHLHLQEFDDFHLVVGFINVGLFFIDEVFQSFTSNVLADYYFRVLNLLFVPLSK
jgi:hypothetical protein